MADKAVEMWGEMLSLIEGKDPKTQVWRSEIPNGVNLPGSWNKPLVCNTAEGFYGFLTGKTEIIRERLDWWVEFCRSKPLGGAEGLSPEEIYRGMPITAAFGGAALAKKVGHLGAEIACGRNARANVTFLAFGVGAGPGKRVGNHHLNNPSQPCVLIGDDEQICELPFVAVAGPRGWVRNRKKGELPLFQFTTSISFSWLLAKVAGKNPRRSLEPFGHDLCAATVGFEPEVDFYGFSAQDREDLRLFVEDPTSAVRAQKLLRFVQGPGLAPSQGYTFIRYIDGSVAVYMHRSQTSSTDPTMICVWYRGGKTAMTSADDGLRSSSDPQRAWETATEICCQKLSGGPVMSIPKPAVAEAYRIVSNESGVVTMTVGGKPSPPSVPAPTPAPPAADCGPKPSKPGWWRRSKVKRAYRAALAAWEACRAGAR